MSEAPTRAGLEDVIVADTRISNVDGRVGRLVLQGYDLGSLAGVVPFEAACHLLWTGRLPAADEVVDLRARLSRARHDAFARLSAAEAALAASDIMVALRSGVSLLVPPSADSRNMAEDLVASVSVLVGAWARRHAGRSPVPPAALAGAAQDLLAMITGEPANPRAAAALDTYLTTVIDHGFNASTFAARVVASTRSDMVSAVVAAIGALKGPLHGGAPGPVLDMLDAVASPERARPWIDAELAAGRRIMGMGHRVYRVRDPRAAVLESALRRLDYQGGSATRVKLAHAVEQAAEAALGERYPDRHLRANVEFYTAVLLEAVGIPRSLFSAIFAASRTAGWCAHVLEQHAADKLIRPRARYIGPLPD